MNEVDQLPNQLPRMNGGKEPFLEHLLDGGPQKDMAHTTKLGSRRILIVEDEEKTADNLKKGLEEEGFEIELARDGQKGLEQALSGGFDLLLLDVMLPGMDGWAILEELRKKGKETLTLFLTARDGLEDRVKGLNLGADAYLMKPFAFSELLATIKTLFRRVPGRGEHLPFSAETPLEIKIGDLTIDVLNDVATREGKRLELTQKEFALLLLLAKRCGEILSRATISKEVWKIQHDAGSNCVDVHIRRLRAKVDDPWERKLIRTVRGVGYSIEDEN